MLEIKSSSSRLKTFGGAGAGALVYSRIFVCIPRGLNIFKWQWNVSKVYHVWNFSCCRVYHKERQIAPETGSHTFSVYHRVYSIIFPDNLSYDLQLFFCKDGLLRRRGGQ